MPPRWKKEDPVDYFNRVFHRPAGSGRPVTSYRTTKLQQNYGQRVRDIARGTPSVKAATTRAYNTASKAHGSIGSGAQVGNALDSLYNKLITEFTDVANQSAAIDRANVVEEQSPADLSMWEKFIRYMPGTNTLGVWEPPPMDEGFAGSPFGRGVDLASRLPYGLFEGIQSLAEIPESGQGWNPGDLGSAFATFGRGVGRGLSGHDKTGFGQAYESYKDNPATAFGPGLQELEREHPAVEQALAIGIGAAGEFALDPTDWFMPAMPAVLRGTGELATEATIRTYLRNAAGKVVEDAINANPSLIPSHMTPDAYVQAMMNQTDELISRSILETTGGAKNTKLLNNNLFSQVFGNNVSASLQEKILGVFNNVIDDFARRAPSGGFTEAAVIAWRHGNDNFDNFWTRLVNDAANDGIIPVGATERDVLDAIRNGTISPGRINKARKAIVDSFEGEFTKLTTDLIGTARNPTYRTLGLRVGKKTVKANVFGKAFNWAGGGANDAARILGKSFEKQFPGLLAGKTGAARALGFAPAADFQKMMRDFIRKYGFTPAEAEELDKLRVAGTAVTDPRTQAGLDFLEKHYSDLWDEQVTNGVRSATATKGDKYTFIFNRGGSAEARQAFKEGRKLAIQDPTVIGAGRYTKAEAAARGLNPAPSAFENLWQYYIKSRRDMTRAFFHQDIVDNYGMHIRGSLSKQAKELRGLVRVPSANLNEAYRNVLRREGGNIYIPTGMDNVIKTFNDITSWTPKDFGRLGRSYAKIMNIIKTGLTLPYPGFHVRNMIGDVFMGLMDDINPAAYERVIRKWTLEKAHQTSVFKFAPGFERTFKQMKKLFDDNADAGFINSDLGEYQSLTAGSIPNNAIRKTVGAMRRGSDMREGFGRFVHFVEAFRQEAKELIEKGMNDMTEVERRATEAAVWRVNHFKFDYQALTVFEKNLKHYAFPFYTYLRKAAPLLVEQLFLNPHYLSTANRFMEYNDGTDNSSINPMNIPQFYKDLGFGFVSGGAEPTALTADILPFGALELLTQSDDPGDFSRELISNLNPFLRTPIEQAFGRRAFDNRPAKDLLPSLLENLPLIQDIPEAIEQGTPNLTSRLWGAGLPFHQLTREQQLQQQRTNADVLLEQPMDEFNHSNNQYHISMTGEGNFQIRDMYAPPGSPAIAEFPTPQEAVEWAKKNLSLDAPALELAPYEQPSWNNMMEMLSAGGTP